MRSTLSRRLEQRLELLPLPVHAIDARLHRRLLCAQLDGSRGVAARRKHLLAERLELRLRRRDVDLQLRELLGSGGAPLLLPALLVRVIRRIRVRIRVIGRIRVSGRVGVTNSLLTLTLNLTLTLTLTPNPNPNRNSNPNRPRRLR